MLASGIPRRIGRKHPFLISRIFQWRHDTVGGEHNRAIECRKLFALLPPGISIVSYKMLVFLESRIIMSRKHFAMRIHVNSRTFSLAQKLLQVVQVVSADQDTWILPYSDVYLRQFRMPVASGVGTVQQSHYLYSVLSSLKYQSHEFVCSHCLCGNTRQSRLHKGMNGLVGKSQTHGMFVVSCHSLQSVHQQFFQRTKVLVRFSQHSYGS